MEWAACEAGCLLALGRVGDPLTQSRLAHRGCTDGRPLRRGTGGARVAQISRHAPARTRCAFPAPLPYLTRAFRAVPQPDGWEWAGVDSDTPANRHLQASEVCTGVRTPRARASTLEQIRLAEKPGVVGLAAVAEDVCVRVGRHRELALADEVADLRPGAPLSM